MDNKYTRKYEEEIIMKKNLIILTIVYMLFNIISGIAVHAEDINLNMTGKIIINGTEIEEKFVDNGDLIPFRAVFEALGAKVDWYGDIQEALSKEGACLELNDRMPLSCVVIVTYSNEVYTCGFYERKLKGEIQRTMYVNNPNIYDTIFEHELLLEPTGSTGWYEIIDDSIYLYTFNAQYFLKELGFNIEINEEQNTMYITSEV